MRVLVTGHQGYIGTVLVPLLQAAGHEVAGVDTGFFAECTIGPCTPDPPSIGQDVRDVRREDLVGFGAVIHLAALSNDPLGDLNPSCTYDINHRASVRLAEAARAAGVPLFLFSSSCSLYGTAGEAYVTEAAPFAPVTPYGESKALVERDLSALADDRFSPVYLRNATAYGMSPRLRLDIVVNDLVASATMTGEVLIKSDGSPWRPLVHVEDICHAFMAMLEAPRDAVHDQAFNVGATEANYQVRDIADMVQEVVPGSRVVYAPGGEPDKRTYRVDFGKLAERVPGFRTRWTLRQGIEQLYQAYRQYGLDNERATRERFLRIRQIRKLLETGRLDQDLRCITPAPTLERKA